LRESADRVTNDVLVMDKLLLRPEEAAEVLSIGRSRLYELIGRGELASVRIGTSRRVPFEELIRFVEGLREETRTPEPR
jgi:excisionase family DNA binding protein